MRWLLVFTLKLLKVKQFVQHVIHLLPTDEKDLSYPADHDPFLMTFLRPAKFYPKGAFDRLQKYFKFKLKYKKYCEDLTVESARVVFEDELVKYLPLRDVEGRRILLLNCGSELSQHWTLTKIQSFIRFIQSLIEIFASANLINRKVEAFEMLNLWHFSCDSIELAGGNGWAVNTGYYY